MRQRFSLAYALNYSSDEVSKMGIIKSAMDNAGLWLALVSILLAGCTAPATPTLAPTTAPTSLPAASATPVPQPTATLDPDLNAMIVNPTGLVPMSMTRL